jgi:hypothetical protein
METQKIDDKPPNTLFDLSPVTYGVASLAAALVALGSQLLLVIVGVAVAAVGPTLDDPAALPLAGSGLVLNVSEIRPNASIHHKVHAG